MGFGKIVGPMEESSAINLHVSMFGVIPKQCTLGQWRVIVDLPNPERHRVHNLITVASPPCVMSQLIDNLTKAVVQLGREAQLVKMDGY